MPRTPQIAEFHKPVSASLRRPPDGDVWNIVLLVAIFAGIGALAWVTLSTASFNPLLELARRGDWLALVFRPTVLWLVMALVLGAGLDGLDRKLALRDAPIASGGPTEIPEGAQRLPVDLLDATRRFRASETASRLFGAAFVSHFAGLCEAEDASLRRAVSPAEVKRYLEAG